MDHEGDSARDTSKPEQRTGQTDFVNRLLLHDLTNHLLVIEGNVRLLDAELDGSPASERVQTIRRQTEAASSLIRNAKTMLNGTRGEARKIVNVGAAIESEVGHLESAYPDANISVDANGDVGVRASPLLSSVFANLLRNAIEHSDQDNPQVDVAVAVDDDAVQVTVADDGPGIPENVLENVTDLSARDDDGLGLYIVHSLVNDFEGDISVDSNSHGTCVSVSFPLASEQNG